MYWLFCRWMGGLWVYDSGIVFWVKEMVFWLALSSGWIDVSVIGLFIIFFSISKIWLTFPSSAVILLYISWLSNGWSVVRFYAIWDSAMVFEIAMLWRRVYKRAWIGLQWKGVALDFYGSVIMTLQQVLK